jgi:hypothetical protein
MSVHVLFYSSVVLLHSKPIWWSISGSSKCWTSFCQLLNLAAAFGSLKIFPCHVVLLKLKFIILQVTHWARNTEIVFEFAYWQSGTVVHCGQGLEQSMKVIFNIFFVKLQFLLLVAFLGITDEQKV